MKKKYLIGLGLILLLLNGCAYSRLMDQGKQAVQANDFEKATRSYQQALVEKPNDPEAKTQLDKAQKARELTEKYSALLLTVPALINENLAMFQKKEPDKYKRTEMYSRLKEVKGYLSKLRYPYEFQEEYLGVLRVFTVELDEMDRTGWISAKTRQDMTAAGQKYNTKVLTLARSVGIDLHKLGTPKE